MANDIVRFPNAKKPAPQSDFAAAVDALDEPDTNLDIPWLSKPAQPRAPLPPKNLPSFTGTYVGITPWTDEPDLCAKASVAIFESKGVQLGFIIKDGSLTEDMNIGDKYSFTYQPRQPIAFKDDKSHLESAEYKMEYHSPEIAGHFYMFQKPPARKTDVDFVASARPIPLL